LTIIALCLSVLTVDQFRKPEVTHAQQQQAVVLSGVEYIVNGTATVVPFRASITPVAAVVPTTR
jgi:hypothetical protein